ncbi:MAG: response regulator, partial [Pseudomonadota bacterium]
MDFNPAFCEFKGLSREELVGKTDFEVSPKDEAELSRRLDKTVLKSKSGHDHIKQITNAHGEKRWVDSRKTYIEDVDGTAYVLGIFTDITELKEREEVLSRAEKAAIQGSRAKSEFLANMSHEIRTPMNGVLGMAQILKMTELSSEQIEIVTTLERSSEALLTIINDILDFSKMEAGKFEIDPAPFNLRESVDDVAALLGRSAGEKGIELIIRVSPDLPANFIGDASRIRQILINLIGNGIKFTPKGYVALEVNGRVDGCDATLQFAVTDTGIGIAPEKQAAIFNKFEQVDGSATRSHGGTGLGLTITRNLVEAMGGNVTVESAPDKGSRFTFSLCMPLADTEGEDLQFLPDLGIEAHGKSILIIDDIALNREILTAQLEQLGANVDQATSAREAAQLLAKSVSSKKPYDLLISDFQMPEVDGLKFVKAIRQKRDFASLPIIILSSVDGPRLKSEFDTLKVNACIVKPVRSGVLEREIGKALSDPGRQLTAPKSVARLPRRKLPPLGEKARILVAEDNMINQDVLRRLLADQPYTLDFARNGKIALENFKRKAYNLVLMDISMPVMDGLAATGGIRNHELANALERTPIIALTAHALEQEQRTFLEAGMDDIVLKPIEFERLDAKLRHWLGHSITSNVA